MKMATVTRVVEPTPVTDQAWSRVCKPLAAMVDAVMPASEEAFKLLLHLASSCPFEREMWTVVRLIRLTDDPMSRIGTMAQDALRSWEHLEQLSRRDSWIWPDEIVSAPRAVALLNLAVAVRAESYAPPNFSVDRVTQRVETRLEAAADREKAEHRTAFASLANLRQAAYPNLREQLDRWLRL